MDSKLLNFIFSLLFISLLLPQNLRGQVTLSGVLMDGETGENLVYGKVEIEENKIRTSVNNTGEFLLLLKKGEYQLLFTSPGYNPKKVLFQLDSNSFITVELTASFFDLKEVVIEDEDQKSNLEKSSLNIDQIHLSTSEKGIQNSLSEALENKPGLQAFNTGVGVSKPIIRGLMANRVSVINQGLRQEGQQWGMDHGLEIDPFSVERIQIIKGAASLQYGSSASGGVVKILEDLIPKDGLGFQYHSRFKSNNTSFGQSFKLSYRKKNHFLISQYSREDYHDFRVPDSSFTYNGFALPLVNGTLKNTAGNSRSIGLIYGYHSDKIQLRFHFSNYLQKIGLFPGATGIPRAFDLEDLGELDDIDLPNQSVNHQAYKLKINYKIGENWLENNIGLQLNDRQENSNPLAHGFLQLLPDDILAIGLDLKTISHNSLYQWKSNNWKSTIGMDQQYQVNQRSGWEFLLPNFSSYEAGLFGIVEKEENEFFNWNAGFRLQYAKIESQEHLQGYFGNIDSLISRAQPLSKSFSNYSVSAGFTYRPNSLWSHKLNLAKSFRIPVAAELLSNGVHHGTFRHEMGDSNLEIENGLQIDWVSEWKGNFGNLRVSPFFNYFNNFIYLNPSGKFSPLPDAGQIYSYSSAKAIHTGGEVYFESDYHDFIFTTIGMEYVHNLNLNTGLALPFSPPFSQVADLGIMLKKSSKIEWKMGFQQRFTAAQNRVDRNENTSPAYHLFAMNSQLKIQYKNIQMNFGAAIQNMFNRSYLNHLSRYRILNLSEQGRNFILQASFSF